MGTFIMGYCNSRPPGGWEHLSLDTVIVGHLVDGNIYHGIL